jgi:hypothetical protein
MLLEGGGILADGVGVVALLGAEGAPGVDIPADWAKTEEEGAELGAMLDGDNEAGLPIRPGALHPGTRSAAVARSGPSVIATQPGR